MNQTNIYIEKLSTFLAEYGLELSQTAALLALLLSSVAFLVSLIGSRLSSTESKRLKSKVKAQDAEIEFLKEKLKEKVESKVVVEEKVQKQEEKEEKPSPTEQAKNLSFDSNYTDGLEKTRSSFFSKLKGFVGKNYSDNEQAYAVLEELLISSDVGVKTSNKLIQEIKSEFSDLSSVDANKLRSSLKVSLLKVLSSNEDTEIKPEKVGSSPKVILVVGVNGAGKTTSIAKLAERFKSEGASVLLGACDTFRAAAAEQLDTWAERVGVDIVTGEENAKPSTVAYLTMEKAKSANYDVVLVDTAGRLHTKVNLMNELEAVSKLITREIPGSPHETILVVDATSGQNALQQAREFNEKTKLSGIIVTKLDGTPKGGIVVAIKDELEIPIRYLGVGEKVEDLKSFSATNFIEALLDESSLVDEPNADSKVQSISEVKEPTEKPKAVRRRRREA